MMCSNVDNGHNPPKRRQLNDLENFSQEARLIAKEISLIGHAQILDQS